MKKSYYETYENKGTLTCWSKDERPEIIRSLLDSDVDIELVDGDMCAVLCM